MIRLKMKKNTCRQNIMLKPYLGKGLLMSLIISCFCNSFLYKTKASNSTLLQSLAYECFQYRQIQKCSIALNKVEEFQLLAGTNENYKCQTRLLGLEAKLIMAMMKMPKSKMHMENLEDIDKFCSDIQLTPFE